MNGRDFFVQLIPMIKEMITECQKLSKEQYKEWKRETLKVASDDTKAFMSKVFIVIDKYVGDGIVEGESEHVE